MNQMCTDHAVDVPDSPVRSATSQATGRCNKSNDVTKVNHSTSTPCHPALQKFVLRGAKDQPIVIDSGNKGLPLLPPKENGSSRKFTHLATSVTLPRAGSSASGNAYPMRKEVTEKNPLVLISDAVNAQCPQQSGRLFFVNRKASTNGDQKNVNFQKNIELPNPVSSSHGMPRISNGLCNADEADNMNKVGRRINSGEAGAVQNGSSSGGSLCVQPFSSPRVNRQRKLVRNGCISPNNIAKAKQLARTGVNTSGNVAYNDSGSMPSNTPISVDIKEMVTEGNDSCNLKGKEVVSNDSGKQKGKEVVNHPYSSNEPDLRNKNLDGRGSMGFKRKAIESGDSNRRYGKSSEGSGGWRPRNRCTAEMNTRLLFDTEQHVVGDTDGPTCSSQHHNNLSRPRVQLRLNGTQSAAKAHIKRQKQSSTSMSCGESSSSIINDSEAVLVSSCPKAFNPKSAFNSAANFQRIIEVDDSSPQLSRRLHEEARARQVEADELLALELQEQLYSEARGFGVGEIDEHIALSLQQQDYLNNGFPGGRRPVSSTRGSSLFNMCRQSQSTLSSNNRRGSRNGSSALGRTRLRSRFPGRSRTLLPSRERIPLFPEGMNIDTRMEILGALEEISDVRLTTAILQPQRDFIENDYEMLLALDDKNDRNGGASFHQINGLPQSTVQSDNFEEACAICLDIPTIGDTIRHLPCLHKFHKDCIDPWLRRKTSCPVCKSSIT